MGCPIFRSNLTEEEPTPRSKKKLVICGLEGAGKTSILNYLKGGTFTSPESTIGLNYFYSILNI